MFTNRINRIEDFIIFTLAKEPDQSAEQLHERVLSSFGDYTIRAVFKSLRKLQEEGVVINIEGDYRLRLAWALELSKFSEEILDKYNKIPHLEGIMESEVDSVSWNFPDLKRVDDFWMQIALALFQHTEQEIMFYWIRNAWFYLIHPDKELQFQEALANQGKKIYMIVANATKLDIAQINSWDLDVYQSSIACSPFDKERKASLGVIGDYILSVKIAKKLRDGLNRLYDSINKTKKLDFHLASSVLEEKGQCSLILEHNPQKAKKLQRKFERYFGVKGR